MMRISTPRKNFFFYKKTIGFNQSNPLPQEELGQLLFNQWWKKSWRKGEKEKLKRKSRLPKNRKPHLILSNVTVVM